MKISVKEAMLTVTVFAFSALGVQLMLPAQPIVAQDEPAAQQKEGEQQEQEAAPAKPEQEAAQPTDASYQYVAQPGDSYTLMARKAVQTYGINNEVALSQLEILMAETNLTQEAGEPLLVVGQQVEISELAVAKWVENAQAMSDEQEADWERYLPGVDFNTDDVGEANS